MKINKKYKSLKRRKIEKLVKRNSALSRIEREVVLKNYGHYVSWLLGGFIQLQLSDCLYISLFTPDSQFSSQWSPSKIFNINHKISHVAGVLHSTGSRFVWPLNDWSKTSQMSGKEDKWQIRFMSVTLP